jgi:hypothetical protein
MADWIVGLRKAAVESRPGARPDELANVEQQVGLPLPPELRSLYEQMNGGSFEPDVALYGLLRTADSAGVLEETQAGLSGLPSSGVWRFGLRGGGDHLFAAKRSAWGAAAPEGPGLPAWFPELQPEEWVFGRKNTDTGEMELHRSLQALLWNLIPPVESEDFGENTYVKAMTAVQKALEALGEVGTALMGSRKIRKKTAGAPAPRRKAKPKPKPKAKAKTSAKPKRKAKAKTKRK